MASEKLKNLFKIKSIPQVNTEGRDTLPDEETRKRTYHEGGFRDSDRNNGSPSTLKISLEAIYAKFQNEERENEDKQRKLKDPYEKEQGEKNTEIKGLNISLKNKEEQIRFEDDKIDSVKKQIEVIKFEINDLVKKPENYGVKATKGASTKFWIGLFLLIPISLYLFTFYISTSYSAFFKQFTIEDSNSLIQSILDARAFTKAWEDGAIEGAFVTLIPFVFLGLGYLIHMFGEKKSIGNYFKMALLFIITFIFDAILAYQIEEKLYEFNKTFESAPFDLGIAFTKVQFWGIIFAGFIVYIIWGLVFDFVMKEHNERDQIKQAQNKRRKDIDVYKDRIVEHENKKSKIREDIAEINERVETAKSRTQELQRIIDGIIIPSKEYALYATEYMQGWLTFIEQRLPISRNEKNNLVEECNNVYNNHMTKVGANSDSQNTVYVSVV